MRSQLKELMVRLLGRFGTWRGRSFIEPPNAGKMEPIDEAARNVRLGKEAIERREFAAALELFQRVTDSGLEDSEAIYGWGVAAFQFGRTGEALNALHRALNAKWPHPEAALKLAELALIDYDDAGALELYGRALKIAPNFAEAYLGRGKVEARLGLEVEALEFFPSGARDQARLCGSIFGPWQGGSSPGTRSRSTRIFPSGARDQARLCGSIFGPWQGGSSPGNSKSKHSKSFRWAFEINPDFPEAGLRLAEWTLANGFAPEALEIYRRILKIAPDLAEAAYGYGVAALEIGRIEEARESFGRALNHDPEYAAASYRRRIPRNFSS